MVSELTQRLLEEGLKPIVVGGSAVEIYSVGDYQQDIDWDYLRQRAGEESTLQELEQLLQEIRDEAVGLENTSSACG